MVENSANIFFCNDLTVRRIVELEAPFLPALEMLPGLTAELLEENRSWLQPAFMDADDIFRLSYQCYLVQTPHHTILVDSCLGNHKARARPEWHMKSDDRFMRALSAHGLSVDDIDYVMCTHMHVDHVGWNTRLENGRWVPTFPNAKYIFGAKEFHTTEAANRATPDPIFQDSVLPVIEDGRGALVDDDFHIGDHVRLLSTPGHTEGHISFCFGKNSDDFVMTGDLLHVPLQMKYPDLSFVRDKDQNLSARTRRSFLQKYCDTPTLCCTSHFVSGPVGHIKCWGDGFQLDPAP